MGGRWTSGWRRALAVGAGAAIVAATLTYLCTFFAPSLYESRALLYFPQSRAAQAGSMAGFTRGLPPLGEPTAMGLVRNAFISPLVGSTEGVAVGILRSRTCLEAVVRSLGLAQRWNLPIEKAVRRLEERTTVRQDKNSFVTMTAQMETPALAETVLRELYRNFVTRSKDLSFDIGERNKIEVEAILARAKADSERKQQELKIAMQTSPLAEAEEVQKLYFGILAAWTEAAAGAVGMRKALESLAHTLEELVKVGQSYPGNLVALQSTEADFQLLAKEIQARRQKLADVRGEFSDASPEFRQALREAQAADAVGGTIIRAQGELAKRNLTPAQRKAMTQLRAFESEAAELRRAVERLEADLQQSASQYVAVKRARAEYAAALQREALLRTELRLAEVAASRDPAKVQLVDPPSRSDVVVAPRRWLLSGLVGLAVFLAALAPTLSPLVHASETA